MQKSLEALVGARSSPFLAQAVSTAGSPIALASTAEYGCAHKLLMDALRAGNAAPYVVCHGCVGGSGIGLTLQRIPNRRSVLSRRKDRTSRLRVYMYQMPRVDPNATCRPKCHV